jgi:hypothetical protein
MRSSVVFDWRADAMVEKWVWSLRRNGDDTGQQQPGV